MTNKRLLAVEDSRPVLKLIKHVAKRAGYEVDVAETLAQTKALISSGQQYEIATVDYALPDAPAGEALTFTLESGIPSIVMTGSMSDEVRDKLLSQPIVDYIPKETTQALNYLGKLLVRLQRNKSIKVLLVDDSKSVRTYLSSLLARHNFIILEAENGVEGLSVLEQHSDVKLIISDHQMPHMGGIRFTAEVRRKFSKDEIAIIGLSGSDAGSLSARFIKNGANDFLKKPFCHEEFYCRVIQNIEHLEYVEDIQRAANTDYLTGLFNRRYFFAKIPAYIKKLETTAHPCSVAMLDIDHFKRINDGYGHDVGDKVILDLADKLKAHFNDCVIARFGGEEFCVFMPDFDYQHAANELDAFRIEISESSIQHEDHDIDYTVSIGFVSTIDHLAAMVSRADEGLYQAKEQGRNRLISIE
ncbi:diguanylate cyclase response regulator [Saccharobesus litoralis]|uniref:diguanylate cyclase n=1 Tax=Saccharobesus litoralis TaxID=2172099 RepID=A0A2S0VQK4_9ALTE|nr:response regulator [Saccharobesus litoralis]AWB66370.1 diguanylate cyclase response regulator [Saccharobesus litoralis]